MSLSPDTELMSARQAAQYLGVSKAYICRLFSSGKIPAYRVDTDWIVEKKYLRKYKDDKELIPVYYRDTKGWNQDDYYFLFRSLDHLLNNASGRYSDEIDAIDSSKLNAAACAIIVALGANRKYKSLKKITCEEPLTPPILLTDHPSMGQFPEFEKVGIIL